MPAKYQSLIHLLQSQERMKILVIISLFSVVLAAPRFQQPGEWQLWKTQHGKSYQSEQEEMERNVIWQSNKKYIEAHNQNSHILGFTLKMNHFGDVVSSLLHNNNV